MASSWASCLLFCILVRKFGSAKTDVLRFLCLRLGGGCKDVCSEKNGQPVRQFWQSVGWAIEDAPWGLSFSLNDKGELTIDLTSRDHGVVWLPELPILVSRP